MLTKQRPSLYPASRGPDDRTSATTPPQIALDGQTAVALRLSGSWTLEHADAIGDLLASAPREAAIIDATGVDRLDSLACCSCCASPGAANSISTDSPSTTRTAPW
jgi:hypothetical protein